MADPVRLPKPGKDHGNWGDLLNNFLTVAHHSNGTLKIAGDIGDYLQLQATKVAIVAHAPAIIRFEKLETIRGESLSWVKAAPDSVSIRAAGVYAINITINWRDSSAKSSRRYIQIAAGDGFHTEEQIRSAPGVETVQSLFLVVALTEKQQIQLFAQQKSEADLVPDITMLVTKLSGMEG